MGDGGLRSQNIRNDDVSVSVKLGNLAQLELTLT